MSSDDESSIEREPQFQKRPHTPDGAEPKAARALENDKRRADAAWEHARHSVFDEPAILPHRPPHLIEQDWYCRHCGYNLRGLMTGHPCPECGRVAVYEPPPEGAVSYAALVRERSRLRAPGRTRAIALVVSLLGVPLAALCSLYSFEVVGVVGFVVLGPMASEAAKVIAPAMLIERGRFAGASTGVLWFMTLLTATLFAVTQNIIYLTLFMPEAPVMVVAFRWTIGIALHAACGSVSTTGLLAIRRQTHHDGRAPRVSTGIPWLLLAAAIHASYNAYVYLSGDVGYGF